MCRQNGRQLFLELGNLQLSQNDDNQLLYSVREQIKIVTGDDLRTDLQLRGSNDPLYPFIPAGVKCKRGPFCVTLRTLLGPHSAYLCLLSGDQTRCDSRLCCAMRSSLNSDSLLSPVGSHLFGVIVEDSDGAELRPNAAALCEGCTALFVGSLFEFVCNSHISNGRWSGFYRHISQESRVHQEEPDSCDQTHQEDDHQEQQN